MYHKSVMKRSFQPDEKQRDTFFPLTIFLFRVSLTSSFLNTKETFIITN